MLAAGAACRASPPPADEPSPVAVDPRRHALVLVIDTFRADAIGERTHTPVLDGLVRDGEMVGRAWSAGTWTVPSVASLFTGMTVREHGWDLPSAKMGKYPALPDVPTLASVLKGHGFHTTGLWANPYLAEPLGFDRGFDAWTRVSDRSAPAKVAAAVGAWKEGERHFLYVHLLGPHSTLRPSPEAMARHGVAPSWIDPKIGFDVGRAKRNREAGVREAYENAYYAVVEDTDARVGAMLEALGPHRDDTLIVVTSDHGEMLGEHGLFAHDAHVWEQLTNVPLVVVGGGRDLPDTLGIASVPDIVTDGVGVMHRWNVQSDDALPLVSMREGRVAFSPDGRTKGMWITDKLSVFDLTADPEEMSPLTHRDQELLSARAAWEQATPAGTTSMEAVELSAETREELRALGYAH
jgi:membrane-anchored protein YejM (alkaline phosphatase superfamily)